MVRPYSKALQFLERAGGEGNQGTGFQAAVRVDLFCITELNNRCTEQLREAVVIF